MWSRSARLWGLYELGEWDELLREADELLSWDRGQGGTQIEVNVRIVLSLVYAQRGQVADAERQVLAFLPRARQIADPQTLIPALGAAAFVRALGGHLQEAAALAREVEDHTRDHPSWCVRGLSVLAPVSAAAGDLALAQKFLDYALVAPRCHLRDGAVATAQAVIREATGEPAAASACYREAADHWTAWGSVVELAYAKLGVGRTAGDEDALAEATAVFERLRAVPFTALAA
jgi:tetratricopeptide (TPR) repeat protein